MCVYTCVCVSECTCGLFCKFTRTFVNAKVGLPACCYKIGLDYQDGETWDRREEEEVEEEDKDRKCDSSSDGEVKLRRRRR